jgi:crotonobetainyl-CoA:carnitine CoA-transferase CaiB-like acyl-CoA transferase
MSGHPESMPTPAPTGALAGLKVLDFTQSLAGPFCTQQLADLGAEVVKVEQLGVGDSTRAVGPFHASDSERKHSGYFHSINRNKKSLAIDLKAPGAREVILDLVGCYDIVVENFRAGTMERLGLSYEELSARNPRLIYGAIRGFGDPRSGVSPYLEWPSVDVVAQAMGGINAVTGEASHPTKVGPGVGDIVPGMFLTIGILAAVNSRHVSGKGQFVDVAMTDAILALCERIVYQRSFGNMVAQATGNHQPFMAPFGLYPARDGHVAIAAASQPFFDTMCRLLGADDLLADERFRSLQGRGAALNDLVEALSRHTARFTMAELTEKLGGVVPYGPVYTMAEIGADPHFKVREMLPEITLPGISEPLAIAGIPIKMSGTPGTVRTAGPELGNATEAVLSEAGRSQEEIAGLRAQGVIK